jgi:GTPase SAR1 family protein
MGFGDTRFASPTNSFKLLYIGANLATSIVEAIIRDRFETGIDREIMASELDDWGACEINMNGPLKLLDMRGDDACYQLGVSTDILGAKGQDKAREFSQELYDTTDVEGILYPSRLIGKDCIAIYDRGVSKLAATAVAKLETIKALDPSLKALRVTLIRDP